MPSCKAAELDLHIQAADDAKRKQETAAALMKARLEKADALLASADFGPFDVAGVSGWTNHGKYWNCPVFLVPDGCHSGDSVEIRFGIEFSGTEGAASFTLPFTE